MALRRKHGMILILLVLSFTLFAQTASAQTITTTTATTTVRTHTVKQGETLKQIAALYNTTWEVLASANNIANANVINVGQVLTIPAAGTTPAQAAANTYTVQPGDNMLAIAARFNTTVEALVAANSLANPDVLTRGQVLNLPATGGPTTSAPTSTQNVVTVQTVTTVTRTVTNGYYMVEVGDTMYAIGRAFNRNIYDIAETNGILNLNSIYAGQWLRIPGY